VDDTPVAQKWMSGQIEMNSPSLVAAPLPDAGKLQVIAGHEFMV